MKEKEMSLNLCVTCGFDYTYSLKIFLATTQTLYLCLSWQEEIWECRNENSKR